MIMTYSLIRNLTGPLNHPKEETQNIKYTQITLLVSLIIPQKIHNTDVTNLVPLKKLKMNKEMYDEFLPTEERLSLYESSTKDDSFKSNGSESLSARK